jgi:hypothetical protein
VRNLLDDIRLVVDDTSEAYGFSIILFCMSHRQYGSRQEDIYIEECRGVYSDIMLILVAVNYVVPLLARMVRRENAGRVVRPQGHGHLTACVQEGEAGTTREVEAVVLVMPHQCSSCYNAFPHWLQPPPIHHHPGGAPWVHLVHKEALNCGIRCHALCLPSYASRLVVVHT